MVASNYFEHRRAMAHKLGLGRKAATTPVSAGDIDTSDAKPARKGGRAAKDAAKAHLGG